MTLLVPDRKQDVSSACAVPNTCLAIALLLLLHTPTAFASASGFAVASSPSTSLFRCCASGAL